MRQKFSGYDWNKSLDYDFAKELLVSTTNLSNATLMAPFERKWKQRWPMTKYWT